jgi:DNA mismatch repair protein MutL
VLPPAEARKIAAGEVVDRPAALVREFLDNAIDAGSAKIEVVIEEGGIRRTEVIDDGSGMGKEDLALCWYTHATSKIRSLDDLATAETLGFRGEALAAAMAVARLEILTSTDGREAWLLEVGPGEENARITQSRRVKGTSIRALGLFDAIPARKRFLKREGAEGGLCKQAFIDKALAFPALSFRFVQDGQLKCFLPPTASFKERYAQALLKNTEAPFLHEINAQGQGFSAVLVVGGPELYRGDRRQQYVFANGRRIQDYSLLQALEYGVQGWFPNGTHPVGAIYIDIDPSLADFNIHPAKREARFRDPGAIHHAVSSALIDFSRRSFIAGTASSDSARNSGRAEYGTDDDSRNSGEFDGLFTRDPGGNAEYGGVGSGGTRRNEPHSGGMGHGGVSGPLAMEALLEAPPEFAPLPRRDTRDALSIYSADAPDQDEYPSAVSDRVPPSYGEDAKPGDAPGEPQSVERPGGIRYVGRLFGLFILIERGEKLYLIDQHAAHERLLYNRFLSRPIPRQELLVPIPFTTEGAADDQFLESRLADLARLGIVIRAEDGEWHIEALPVDWRLSDSETIQEILELKNAGENIAERWAATLSCHGAIKDGDYLDEGSALALAEEALALPIPRCPHGRPIWVEIRREDLLRSVRRV